MDRRTRQAWMAWAIGGAAAGMLTLAACAGGGTAAGMSGGGGDPLAVILDKKANASKRLDAIDEAWKSSDRAATRETLKTLLWQPAQPQALRLRAAQTLASDESEAGLTDTRNLFRLRLPTETDWELIGYIAETAGKRGWTEMTPALIRSYSRSVIAPTDDQRPERAALLALHPGTDLVDVVFNVFATPASPSDAAPLPEGAAPSVNLDERSRRDAWTLLSRLDPEGIRRTALLSAPDDPNNPDPVLADLRAGARELRTVPITAAEFDWLRGLRDPKDPANAAWWRDAAAAVARLSPSQQDGLQMRHVEPIRWAAAHKPEWLSTERQALLDELTSRQRTRKLFERTIEVGGNMGRPSGRLGECAGRLRWGDCITLLAIDEAVRQPEVVASLFKQVENDRRDTSTEYGGLLQAGDTLSKPTAVGATFVATMFPPRPVQRIADNRFVASDEMIESGPRSLAHYHFHSQRSHNSEYAGPGDGDLEYANVQGRSCLVFTSIDEKTLNVDYYHRGGIVVDLGTISKD